ncbi:hypothetical protein EV385_6713 [Krasilnikovia cinnamomea]|uniref:Uncharacterized protein n=1 Tax=Krasilnikovia cinnamomea TaxID=349313 RepID=A0A4Q7Z809_9ACTN|nr:hypothetical protein [Krasilnikovia cinnamomea]RZU46637.1 hypothetical protein EV385_6713 [Krasilnikovia cinnamomea]
MNQLVAYALSWARERGREAMRRDDGALSVEQVILTVVLLALAVAVAAAITAAVNGRIGGIT